MVVGCKHDQNQGAYLKSPWKHSLHTRPSPPIYDPHTHAHTHTQWYAHIFYCVTLAIQEGYIKQACVYWYLFALFFASCYYNHVSCHRTIMMWRSSPFVGLFSGISFLAGAAGALFINYLSSSSKNSTNKKVEHVQGAVCHTYWRYSILTNLQLRVTHSACRHTFDYQIFQQHLAPAGRCSNVFTSSQDGQPCVHCWPGCAILRR